jgi:HK97 gp10 family phage protein
VSLSRNGFEIKGTEDIAKLLESIEPKHARNLLRSTTHAVAGQLGKMSKVNARQYKDTGVLLKSIKTRRRKSPPMQPVSEVYVLPDAYYWRFVEHGTAGNSTQPPQPERPIFRKAELDIRPKLPQVYAEQFTKKLEQKVKRELKKV